MYRLRVTTEKFSRENLYYIKDIRRTVKLQRFIKKKKQDLKVQTTLLLPSFACNRKDKPASTKITKNNNTFLYFKLILHFERRRFVSRCAHIWRKRKIAASLSAEGFL